MARLYFHLYGNADPLRDFDGIDLPLAAANERALVEVRALIAADALDGRVDLRQRIEIEDTEGVIVHSLTFADAVQIQR